MLTEYINAMMCQAKYEFLNDDEPYDGVIDGLCGPWANADTLERVIGRTS